MPKPLVIAILLVLGPGTITFAQSHGSLKIATADTGPHFIPAWTNPISHEAERSSTLTKRVSLHLVGIPPDAALKALIAEAKLTITYSPSALSSEQRITISDNEIAVLNALTAILLRSGMDVLVDKDGALALLSCRHNHQVLPTKADTGSVSGKITDRSTGIPLYGATISIEGLGIHATTNTQGHYSLGKVPDGEQTVRARFIGYIALDTVITVRGSQLNLDIGLQKSAQRLDEIVTVTPGGAQTQLKALPTPMTVITAEDIQAQQPQTIQDVIRQAVPTAIAFDVPVQPTLTQFSVRGVTSLAGASPMKILVDGVEAARFGSMPVDPASIERIEIIRGPQAAGVYGSDAAGGVIQVFTRRGARNADRPQVDLRSQAGLVQTPYEGFASVVRQQYATSVSGGDANGSYSFGGEYTRMGDWLPGAARSRQSSPSLYGSIRYGNSSFNIDLNARYARNSLPTGLNPELMTSGFVPLSRPEFTVQDWVNAMFGARFTSAPVSWWHNTLTVGFNRSGFDVTQYQRRLSTPADTLFTLASDDQRKVSLFYNSSIQGRLVSELAGAITVGVDHNQLDANFLFTPQALNTEGTINILPGGFFLQTRSTSKNTGYFTQGELGWRESFFLTAGVRAEENTSFGSDISTPIQPRVGVAAVQRLGGATMKLRAAYGRAIRAPAPGFAVTAVGATSITLGNPFLRPERQHGWDAGVDLTFGTWGALGATIYDQIADDLIVLLQIPSDSLPTSQFQNLGRVTNKGVELEGTLAFNSLKLAAQYGYIKSRVRDLGPDVPPGTQVQIGDRPLGQPSHTAGVSITLTPRRGTSVAGGLTYVGSFRQADVVSQIRCFGGTAPCRATPRDYVIDYPGFAKVYLNASQQLTEKLDAFLSIDNLTNNFAFEGLNSFSVTGRMSMVGIHARF